MGLAPGGRMKQEIYEDQYGLDAWNRRHCSRCFVMIGKAAQWMAIAGESRYGGDANLVDGAEKLRGMKTVTKLGKEEDETPLPENESVDVHHIITLRQQGSAEVREMS